MIQKSKYLVWLSEEVKTPPFSRTARLEIGWLLRKLQMGENLRLPESRPMKIIGSNCHELRIKDKDIIWRIIYHIHSEAIVVLEIFKKKTNKTPSQIIKNCKLRLKDFYKKIK